MRNEDLQSAGQKDVPSDWAYKSGLHPGPVLVPCLLFPFLLPFLLALPRLQLQLIQQLNLRQPSQYIFNTLATSELACTASTGRGIGNVA